MDTTSKIYPFLRHPKDVGNNLCLSTLYYLRLFERYFNNNKQYPLTWNWSAALFGGSWMAYRKMYLYTILFEIAWLPLYFIKIPVIINLMLFIISFFIFGFYGNRIYIHHIENEMSKNRVPHQSVSLFGLIVYILLPLIVLLGAGFIYGFFESFFDLFQYFRLKS